MKHPGFMQIILVADHSQFSVHLAMLNYSAYEGVRLTLEWLVGMLRAGGVQGAGGGVDERGMSR